VIDSGPRGIVEAAVEDVAVPMLVHANAGFTVMLTHDALHRLTGRVVEKETDFGLDHDLRLSPRGRSSTTLRSLEVEGVRLDEVPCAVFDLPTTNWDGMLGVGWLAATRPVVDFGSRTLSFARATVAGDRVEMSLDESLGRYVAELLVDGAPATFVVNTVADTTLDLSFARRRGLELVEETALEHGPTGVVVPVHRTARPVELALPGIPLATLDLPVHDTYAYRGEERATDAPEVAGFIGADVLLATRAVLDFGARL
jgi:hypothetical protein